MILSNRQIKISIISLFFILSSLIIISIIWLAHNPKVIVLISNNKSKWIRPSTKFFLGIRKDSYCQAYFKSNIEYKTHEKPILTIQALKIFKVFINEKLIFSSPEDFNQWGKKYQINLRPYLKLGKNSLIISSINQLKCCSWILASN